ncbi:vacuolar fusion protein CCZ1 homolog [Pollicipes pollicipes]|uniref:vacuolar fusion protein CCZ1 homolog n=1 Tax=Pollicipes pollicipes TaxID=41117 RepID=UPI00188570F0|nr:vacuolar fusion protein CCZ1 homolog [Pollicipes pollicipes]XP_037093840.1 vacuolar fusion protein CCZ1 homolog [Pollicipes pollicipes]XP_037093841.1 vacuolar fusion protein CCZ1 homolog [Pollicipes pollicipes]
MAGQDKSGLELSSFFIFNSTFGPREGEEEKKVIYYHPRNTDINAQVKDVGLVEALVQFARTFNTEAPVHCLQTLKHKHFYLEPEKDFFMVLVVRLPVVKVTRDSAPCREYVPSAVQQPVYLALLRHMYQLYRLLSGLMTGCPRQQLAEQAAAIFDSYLPQLQLQQRDIMDIYTGVRFLPLDKLSFLRLQSFVNQLEVEHPFIRHTVLYFKEHLVWSGLGRTNMNIINHYLATVLFPECGSRPSVWRDRDASTSGIFMSTEAASGEQPDECLSPPVVHLRKHNCSAPQLGGASGSRDGDDSVDGEAVETADQPAQMVMYRLIDMVVVLMLDTEVRPTMQLCRQLDVFMASRVQELSALLARSLADRGATKDDPDTKVIYYNRYNLAQKTSMHEEGGRAGVPEEARQLMVDLREDALSFGPEGGAVFGRAINESWVAGRVAPDREFFTVIQQKGANLMDVNGQVDQLCRDQFASIFFPA